MKALTKKDFAKACKAIRIMIFALATASFISKLVLVILLKSDAVVSSQLAYLIRIDILFVVTALALYIFILFSYSRIPTEGSGSN